MAISGGIRIRNWEVGDEKVKKVEKVERDERD
jgi:hypothetical protein